VHTGQRPQGLFFIYSTEDLLSLEMEAVRSDDAYPTYIYPSAETLVKAFWAAVRQGAFVNMRCGIRRLTKGTSCTKSSCNSLKMNNMITDLGSAIIVVSMVAWDEGLLTHTHNLTEEPGITLWKPILDYGMYKAGVPESCVFRVDMLFRTLYESFRRAEKLATADAPECLGDNT